MSHSPCVIGVRSAAGTLPARRWADMVDEEWALPAIIPRTPPDELPALPGEGQVSYQLPAVSETTEAWLPAESTVVDTAPRSAPDFSSFQSFSSVDSGGTAGLFTRPGEGQVSYQLPAVSENTKTWLPAQSTVVDTAPRSAPNFNSFKSLSSASYGGNTELFNVAHARTWK